MILKFNKCLNDKNEFTLISFDMTDKMIDCELFNQSNLFDDNENYYYFIDKIIDIGNCEKFKIKTKKGDIVSLTARDNSYIVFPSKKTFSIAFNLKYNEVLSYKYEEVILDGKPYEVKYVKDKDDKTYDGVVYTLSQLCTYISTIIKGINYKIINKEKEKKQIDIIHRVINKWYDSNKENKINKKYELNIKKVWVDDNNKWHSANLINVSKSNKYLYDYYLVRMFAYMIYVKSMNDINTNNNPLYCFDKNFDSLEDVYKYLEDNQDIVNNFFIETEMIFNNPNAMFTSYSPDISGVYMYYDYNNMKTYLYRNIDRSHFIDKSLKCTYVSKRFRHKIKGIKYIYEV